MNADHLLGALVGVIATFFVSAGAALLMVGLTARRQRPQPRPRTVAKPYGESPEWLYAAAKLGLPVQSYEARQKPYLPNLLNPEG